MSDIISRRQRTPWFWSDPVYYLFGDGQLHNKTLSVLHSFTYKVSRGRVKIVSFVARLQPAITHVQRSPQVIKERAASVSSCESDSDSDQGGKKRRAFLDMLLQAVDEDGNKMSHQDIQEEVDTFMFEVASRQCH